MSNINEYNVDKMYTYLRGYLTGAKFSESMRALSFAREKHNGQLRKDGLPYIVHPLDMACYAAALHIDNDYVIATILLHDVCEDCGVPLSALPVCDEVKTGVKYMTIIPIEGEEKSQTKKRYFKELLNCKYSVIVKGIDRYKNLSSMAGVLSDEAVIKNVKETHNLLLPVLKEAKDIWPELSDILFILRTNIKSINYTLARIYNIELEDIEE